MPISDETPALAAALGEVLEAVLNAEASLLASNFEWSEKKIRQKNFELGMAGLENVRTKLQVLIQHSLASSGIPTPKGEA